MDAELEGFLNDRIGAEVLGVVVVLVVEGGGSEDKGREDGINSGSHGC